MRGRIYNSPPKVKKIKPNYLTTFQDFYVEKVLEYKTSDGYTGCIIKIRSLT